MFQNWLKPIDPNTFLSEKLRNFQFGEKIQVHSKSINKLDAAKIAIIGFEEEASNHIRQELYQMSSPFAKNKVVDLGNVRKKEISFTIPLLKELLDSGILPIVLSAEPKSVLAQYKALKRCQPSINMVRIDERFRFDLKEKDKKQYFLNEIIFGKRSKLFNLGLIGPQTHYVNPKLFDFLEQQHFDCVRLGNAKANLAELEPVIRDGDLLSFDLSALKRSEAPEQLNANPSGFTSEEACQICRYAGMSDKLKAFGIFGYEHFSEGCISAQVMAQMIWYFIDGYFNRKGDFPASTDGLIEYLVDFKDLDKPITFWKSKKSSRWWMQVQVKTNKKIQQHRLIPCSYNDYKRASQQELSPRLFNAYQRFL
jgi:formiminoglutamase